MKVNKMICKYCGKEFYTEYSIGGYIDHYENFSSRHNSFGKDDVEAICYHGNDIRYDEDIAERLNCYLKWDNVPVDIKIRVKGECEILINKIINEKGSRRSENK